MIRSNKSNATHGGVAEWNTNRSQAKGVDIGECKGNSRVGGRASRFYIISKTTTIFYAL